MSSSSSSEDISWDGESSGIGPINSEPFRSISQKYIDAGQIEKKDIEAIFDVYRKYARIPSIAGIAGGLGSLFYMKYKKPHIILRNRYFLAFGGSILGTIAGYCVASFSAGREISQRVVDPQKKMSTVARISMDTRRAIIEERRIAAGIDAPSLGSLGSLDRPVDNGRMPEMQSDRTAGEGTGANGWNVDNGSFSSGASGAFGGIADGVKQGTSSTWDQIRSESIGTPAAVPSTTSPAPSRTLPFTRGRGGRSSSDTDGQVQKEDTRSAEQKAHDALLERERQGIIEEDKWE